jgi:hypothetical protein
LQSICHITVCLLFCHSLSKLRQKCLSRWHQLQAQLSSQRVGHHQQCNPGMHTLQHISTLPIASPEWSQRLGQLVMRAKLQSSVKANHKRYNPQRSTLAIHQDNFTAGLPLQAAAIRICAWTIMRVAYTECSAGMQRWRTKRAAYPQNNIKCC